MKKEKFSEFFGNLNHEINTSITIINSSIEIETEEREGKGEEISDELKQAKNELDVIKDSFFLHRYLFEIEFGGKISKRKTDLSSIAKRLCEKYSFILKNFKYSIKENIIVIGDDRMLEFMFENLLDNAKKHSGEKDKIKFSLKKNKEYITIKVEDNGFGIEEGEEELIFEKYYRSIVAKRNGIRGVGLGLYIIKKYLQKIKGEISSEINKNGGLNIMIKIPVA